MLTLRRETSIIVVFLAVLLSRTPVAQAEAAVNPLQVSILRWYEANTSAYPIIPVGVVPMGIAF